MPRRPRPPHRRHRSTAECKAPNLKTLTAGKLTIGTDNPAFPPWFGGDPPTGSVWQVSDPTSQKGLESATAYAIAQQLGFAPDKVVWIAVPFNNAIQPGPKKFDILLNQVGLHAGARTGRRSQRRLLRQRPGGRDGRRQDRERVDRSPTSKKYQLGVQVGTTSLTYINDVIKPDKKARVYNTNDAAIAALKAKQVDGHRASTSGTAFYMTAAQLDNGSIVGTLPQVGESEHFSVLLQKGSALTPCVNQAIAVLQGRRLARARSAKIWIEAQGSVPALTP